MQRSPGETLSRFGFSSSPLSGSHSLAPSAALRWSIRVMALLLLAGLQPPYLTLMTALLPPWSLPRHHTFPSGSSISSAPHPSLILGSRPSPGHPVTLLLTWWDIHTHFLLCSPTGNNSADSDPWILQGHHQIGGDGDLPEDCPSLVKGLQLQAAAPHALLRWS